MNQDREKIIELIKTAITSDKFEFCVAKGSGKYKRYRSDRNRVNVEFREEYCSHTITTTEYYGSPHVIGLERYDNYEIQMEVLFNDKDIPPIIINKKTIYVACKKHKIRWFDKIKAILGLKQCAHRTYVIDLGRELATISMGETIISLNHFEYGAIAKELIELCKDRKERDLIKSRKTLSGKIDDMIKKL